MKLFRNCPLFCILVLNFFLLGYSQIIIPRELRVQQAVSGMDWEDFIDLILTRLGAAPEQEAEEIPPEPEPLPKSVSEFLNLNSSFMSALKNGSLGISLEDLSHIEDIPPLQTTLAPKTTTTTVRTTTELLNETTPANETAGTNGTSSASNDSETTLTQEAMASTTTAKVAGFGKLDTRWKQSWKIVPISSSRAKQTLKSYSSRRWGSSHNKDESDRKNTFEIITTSNPTTTASKPAVSKDLFSPKVSNENKQHNHGVIALHEPGITFTRLQPKKWQNLNESLFAPATTKPTGSTSGGSAYVPRKLGTNVYPKKINNRVSISSQIGPHGKSGWSLHRNQKVPFQSKSFIITQATPYMDFIQQGRVTQPKSSTPRSSIDLNNNHGLNSRPFPVNSITQATPYTAVNQGKIGLKETPHRITKPSLAHQKPYRRVNVASRKFLTGPIASVNIGAMGYKGFSLYKGRSQTKTTTTSSTRLTTIATTTTTTTTTTQKPVNNGLPKKTAANLQPSLSLETLTSLIMKVLLGLGISPTSNAPQLASNLNAMLNKKSAEDAKKSKNVNAMQNKDFSSGGQSSQDKSTTQNILRPTAIHPKKQKASVALQEAVEVKIPDLTTIPRLPILQDHTGKIAAFRKAAQYLKSSMDEPTLPPAIVEMGRVTNKLPAASNVQLYAPRTVIRSKASFQNKKTNQRNTKQSNILNQFQEAAKLYQKESGSLPAQAGPVVNELTNRNVNNSGSQQSTQTLQSKSNKEGISRADSGRPQSPLDPSVDGRQTSASFNQVKITDGTTANPPNVYGTSPSLTVNEETVPAPGSPRDDKNKTVNARWFAEWGRNSNLQRIRPDAIKSRMKQQNNKISLSLQDVLQSNGKITAVSKSSTVPQEGVMDNAHISSVNVPKNRYPMQSMPGFQSKVLRKNGNSVVLQLYRKPGHWSAGAQSWSSRRRNVPRKHSQKVGSSINTTNSPSTETTTKTLSMLKHQSKTEVVDRERPDLSAVLEPEEMVMNESNGSETNNLEFQPTTVNAPTMIDNGGRKHQISLDTIFATSAISFNKTTPSRKPKDDLTTNTLPRTTVSMAAVPSTETSTQATISTRLTVLPETQSVGQDLDTGKVPPKEQISLPSSTPLPQRTTISITKESSTPQPFRKDFSSRSAFSLGRIQIPPAFMFNFDVRPKPVPKSASVAQRLTANESPSATLSRKVTSLENSIHSRLNTFDKPTTATTVLNSKSNDRKAMVVVDLTGGSSKPVVKPTPTDRKTNASQAWTMQTLIERQKALLDTSVDVNSVDPETSLLSMAKSNMMSRSNYAAALQAPDQPEQIQERHPIHIDFPFYEDQLGAKSRSTTTRQNFVSPMDALMFTISILTTFTIFF